MAYFIEWVTPEVMAALEDALDAAILAREQGETQAQINAALAALNEAIETFMDAKQDGELEVNESIMQQLIAAAEALVTGVTISDDGSDVSISDYWVTPEAILALEEALAAVKAAIAEDDIIAAYIELNEAIAAFNDEKQHGTKGGIVVKVDPVITTWPSASAVTYGAVLSTSTLTGGISNVSGTFAWTTPSIPVGDAGTRTHNVTFTPDDTDNYNTLSQSVDIIVNKASPVVTTWPSASAITYGAALSTSGLTGGVGAGEFAWTNSSTIPTVNNSGYSVTFTPDDAANYNTRRRNVSITVNKAEAIINCPVERITWYDAVYFCNKLSILEGFEPVYTITGISKTTTSGLTYISNATVAVDWTKNGYRLPTEAEWEYAARGDYPNKATETATKPFGIGDGTKLTWEMANINGQKPYDLAATPPGEYDDPSGKRISSTTPVGDYDPNNYGLYDMHGNVEEWCWDWYRPDYITYGFETRTTDGAGANEDPAGPFDAASRIMKGGYWNDEAQNARSAYRSSDNSSTRGSRIGFRLVRR
ncbi:MAG: formylglycine-generating enzyme family protein [Treponema sp.]|nr:formylglycine-generating enzyme family protein [Treponema sp.]